MLGSAAALLGKIIGGVVWAANLHSSLEKLPRKITLVQENVIEQAAC